MDIHIELIGIFNGYLIVINNTSETIFFPTLATAQAFITKWNVPQNRLGFTTEELVNQVMSANGGM